MRVRDFSADGQPAGPGGIQRPACGCCAPLQRRWPVSNKYRYKLLIKCRNSPQLREMVSRLLIQFASLREFQQVTAYADPDPYRIL